MIERLERVKAIIQKPVVTGRGRLPEAKAEMLEALRKVDAEGESQDAKTKNGHVFFYCAPFIPGRIES